MLPQFIIGGATASGSSFLTHLLMQHQDVYLPKDPYLGDPHFFSITYRYKQGFSYYRQWFTDKAQGKCVGESSSTYLHFPESAERIKENLSTVKLIFLLRNPIDRAWAHYRYMVLRGIETLDFQAALNEEELRRDDELKKGILTRHHDYANRSLYGEQLEHYLKFFSFDQILLIDSQTLRKQTHSQLERITTFLGIEPLKEFQPVLDFSSLSVKDPDIQAKARQHFGIRKNRAIIEAIRNGEKDLSQFVESDADQDFVNLIKNNLYEFKEELPPQIRMNLQDYFRNDQVKFFALTQGYIDFGPWYNLETPKLRNTN